ncbi:MAG: DNA mismatch repair protein MutS [Verrucomicrobia bacterium]|nr:DNA mismatch repair protein MutS [Verrucomicrobiota bacterium]MCH8513725.1 DNA mismatch repair protein MutS [Kiritimatiellia bacterium]
MANESTPMMKQYRQIRNSLPPEVILFFRLGDFYEMFFEDAVTASSILEITLTKRQKVPMCGVPFHSADGYMAKLIRAGKKVAICDQVENPAEVKGIVRREVVRIVTPGTVIEDNVLESSRANYLAGLHLSRKRWGMALLDISTGDFRVEESDRLQTLLDSLTAAGPAELLVAEEEIPHWPQEIRQIAPVLTPYEDWTFEGDAAADLLTRHFQVQSLEGFGCQHLGPALGAAGAVLHYVTHKLHNRIEHIRRIQVRNPDDFMMLDEATSSNLELVDPRDSRPAHRSPTLLKVIDSTRTALGARLLRAWMQRPLTRLDQIRDRHDAVSALLDQRAAFRSLREQLGEVKDLERLLTRLHSGGGNPREVQTLSQSLRALPTIKETLLAVGHAPRLKALGETLCPLPELTEAIDTALVDEPPVNLKDGGVIRNGVHPELDELRNASTEGRQWLAKFQADEQSRTGIKSLKVRHNKVFGYYIEVSKANMDLVPEDYQRKQTLANAERFITPALKEVENKILGAHERAVNLEQELFAELREKVLAHTNEIQQSAGALAELDVLACFADRAMTLRYVRPEMREGDALDIRDGRHPVIETLEDSERFVPNDTSLDTREQQLHILTGPNMAGKSTYIRQVALIVILAQIGSYVPASEAKLCVVDRVFTRVGASDDLARGRSTFMVEMQETANILNNVTPRSLVILDEIGRGTSTYDGISIAWAVAEHLHQLPACKAKTLFATHYHELTQLPETLSGAKNYSVAVRERGEQIVFLRKIVEGAADRSYGIQVARLAGLPDGVVSRAREILYGLEAGSHSSGQPQLVRPKPRKPKENKDQLRLFDEV